MTERAKKLIKRWEQLVTDRSTWEAHWEEVAERVLPRAKHSFLSGARIQTHGEKRTQKMFDSTAAIALERFAAAMESMLTPRNMTWHRLTASDPVLMKRRDVRLYLEEVNRRLFRARYSPRANFAGQNHENFMSLGAFGTAGMFIDEQMDGEGIRYRAMNLSEFCFEENHQGVPDRFYRKFSYTVRQIKQKWPDVALPDRLEKIWREQLDKQSEEFDILHVVMPRADYDARAIGPRSMPYASIYILWEEYTELSEGGYGTFPIPISRYVTGPGEKYGRSPAMTALASIKVLNEEKKTILKQGHRALDPVLLAHDDGVIDEYSMKPGGIIGGGVSADGRPLVHTLPTGNIAVGEKMMQQEQMVINDAFLVSLFQILVEAPQMTATEVMERAREKGSLLSPTMGRQQSENYGRQIEREVDILARRGQLPPMPPALAEAEGEFEILYDSPLSRAQRAEEAAGFLRWSEYLLNYANVTQDASPLDWINVDEAAPDLADIHAVPVRWVSTMEQVEAFRQARAEQAQTQQMIEAAPAAAGVMKAVQGGAA